MSALRRIAAAAIPLTPRRALERALLRARSPFYRGSRFECPCCGGCFRRLLRAGSGRRENARCPRCGSFERHRLLWLFLERRTGLLRDELRVLHVAPEFVFTERLRALGNLDYVTADLSSPLAAHKLDITAIPFGDASFDAVLCNHVLEHVPDDRRALSELYRVLRPGGWAILQHPVTRTLERTFEDPCIVTPSARARAFGQADHVRVYGRDFEDRVRDAGFDLEWIPFARELGGETARRYALRRSERICYCTRSRAEA